MLEAMRLRALLNWCSVIGWVALVSWRRRLGYRRMVWKVQLCTYAYVGTDLTSEQIVSAGIWDTGALRQVNIESRKEIPAVVLYIRLSPV